MDLSVETQENMLARMRRIEGQARGVQRMIAEGRDCLDILTQLASLRSAAYSVSVALTQHYAVQCLHDLDQQQLVAGQQGVSLDKRQGADDAMRGLVDVLLRTPH
jgi:DNA-binding FrmR family transcriptional regulator